MAQMPAFPFIISASGNYMILAPNALCGPDGTLIQLTGSAGSQWTAYLRRNVSAGVEPPSFQIKPYVNRATGYDVTDGSGFGDTDSPVSIESIGRGMEQWLIVTLVSGTITVNCSAAAGTARRPAGASVFDLNFDQTPAALIETDMELAIDSAVSTQNGT